MIKRIIYLLSYGFFWLFFFWVARLLFLIYQYQTSFQYGIKGWIDIFSHGLKLDLSIAAYLTVLPGIMIALSCLGGKKLIFYVLNVYTLLFIFLLTFISVVDIELYSHWGFRLDTSPLLYLKTPYEAMASVPFKKLIFLLSVVVLVFTFFAITYISLVAKQIIRFKKVWPFSLIFFLLITGLLFIPIRGGFDIIPINIGSAYFHKDPFPNHAAINVVWNFGYSLVEKWENNDEIKYFENAKAQKLFNSLYTPDGATYKILNTEKPNILLILVESLTGKVIKEISGKEGVTPNISRLIKEGVFFCNFYASGDRTDKGLVSIISGFPSQPLNSIIKYSSKTQKLPNLSKDLDKIGYHSAFYYGGNIDFANMRSYLAISGFNKLVSKSDFNPEFYNSKWGVHDHLVFNRLLNELNDSQMPFFTVLLTLSSHQPFDVPFKSVFNGNDEDSQFLNSICYTDSCIGNFIDKAKMTNWWKNTLIIIVADHGVRLPGNTPNFSFEKHIIPMLWLGGVLNVKDTIIRKYACQTDIPKTILAQLNRDTHDYKYSKDILGQTSPSFAFYVYNDGCGFVNERIKVMYNNLYKAFDQKDGVVNEDDENYGKAYLQLVMKDFNEK